MFFLTIGAVLYGMALKADELGVTRAPQQVEIPQGARDVIEAFHNGGFLGAGAQLVLGKPECNPLNMSERQKRRYERRGLPRRCGR